MHGLSCTVRGLACQAAARALLGVAAGKLVGKLDRLPRRPLCNGTCVRPRWKREGMRMRLRQRGGVLSVTRELRASLSFFFWLFHHWPSPRPTAHRTVLFSARRLETPCWLMIRRKSRAKINSKCSAVPYVGCATVETAALSRRQVVLYIEVVRVVADDRLMYFSFHLSCPRTLWPCG